MIGYLVRLLHRKKIKVCLILRLIVCVLFLLCRICDKWINLLKDIYKLLIQPHLLMDGWMTIRGIYVTISWINDTWFSIHIDTVICGMHWIICFSRISKVILSDSNQDIYEKLEYQAETVQGEIPKWKQIKKMVHYQWSNSKWRYEVFWRHEKYVKCSICKSIIYECVILLF